jgi:hypothetical protein
MCLNRKLCSIRNNARVDLTFQVKSDMLLQYGRGVQTVRRQRISPPNTGRDASMRAGRWAILALLAGFCLACTTAGLRHVKQSATYDSTRIPRDCAKPTCSPSIPRPCSVAIYSPWRNRIKSVLEETDPRITEESDLGLVVTPNPVIPFSSSGSSLTPQLTTIPLRC